MRDDHRTNSLFVNTGAHCSRETCWRPRADVYRCSYGWFIKFDLAGVRPEDVAVSLLESQLFVSGIRRDLFVEEDYNIHSIEISYSRFERTIRLSGDIKPANVITEYRDGMLLVKVTN